MEFFLNVSMNSVTKIFVITVDFFHNSFEQIELIKIIRQISTETLIVISLSVVIFKLLITGI